MAQRSDKTRGRILFLGPIAYHGGPLANEMAVPAEDDTESPFVRDRVERAVESFERRQGDLELLDRLAAAGFAGPVWDRFVQALAGYGHEVVLAWLRSGEMFTQCRKRHRRLRPPPASWNEDDKITLATDTLVEAIPYFRDKGLRQGQWRPDGGASMRTYFVGTCVLVFPNVYRRWYSQNSKEQDGPIPWQGDLAGALSVDIDPAELAVRRVHLAAGFASIPDDRTKKAIVLQELGYTHREIAELLTITPGAVKEILRRQRERGQRAAENGGDHA